MYLRGYDLVEEEIMNIMNEICYVGIDKINYSNFIAATLNEKVFMDEEKL